MQSLIYSFALAFSITFVWFVQILYAQTYNILEIAGPPSPYGPPQVYIRSGSHIDQIGRFYENYLSQPSPNFIDKYRIAKGPIDEIRILSNLPSDRIDQISARLIDMDGATLANWNNTSFRSTSFDEAKNAQQANAIPEDAFASGMRIDAQVWHFPNAQPHFWLKPLFAQTALSAFFYAMFRFLPLYRDPLRRIFRILGRTPFFAENMRPIFLSLSCLLAIILVSAGIWLIFGTYYGTIDDPFMALIAKGYLMKTPDWHLFFIHPAIGFILVHLYETIPLVPWYALFMIFLNVLSISTVLYTIMRRSSDLYRIVLSAALILISGIYLIAWIQFTMVSTMACLAAVALMLGNAGQSTISKTRLAAAIIFFLIGAAVRIQPVLLVIILAGPCACYLWFRGLLPGARRFTLAVLIGLALLAFTESKAYQLFPDWRDAKSYDIVRGILNGTEIMKRYEDNADAFKAIGWSKNDLEMFNEGLYEDANVYSKEKLSYLATHVHQSPVDFESYFWVVFRDVSKDFADVVLYLSLLIFVLSWRLMPRIQALTLAVPCLIVLCYLATVIRLPQRVLSPTMFMELTLLLLLANFDHIKIKLRSGLFGVIVITLLLSMLLIDSISGTYNYSQYSGRRQRSTVEALTYLSKRDSPIIVNTICGTSADQTYPWQDFPELRNIRILQLAWFESPIYSQRMERFGLSDIFSDLTHRPDLVLAITRWDLPQITVLETFIREHKGMRVKFELAKIPGTDQDAVFPFFSLFKVKIDSD
jgi:hypothetical protein